MLLTIALLISLVTNLIILKLLLSSNKKIVSKSKELEEMEKRHEVLDLELSKDKEIYNLEREALIAENANYQTQLTESTRKLEEYSREKSIYYSQMDDLNNYPKEMDPVEFITLAKEVNDKNSELHDFTGIYILENKTHDKFYVGQSISLFKRVSNHFTGKGNADIYSDYMAGDVWSIKLISLSNSGFKSINALEKHFIEYHHSTYNGYNRTIGNANW